MMYLLEKKSRPIVLIVKINFLQEQNKRKPIHLKAYTVRHVWPCTPACLRRVGLAGEEEDGEADFFSHPSLYYMMVTASVNHFCNLGI